VAEQNMACTVGVSKYCISHEQYCIDGITRIDRVISLVLPGHRQPRIDEFLVMNACSTQFVGLLKMVDRHSIGHGPSTCDHLHQKQKNTLVKFSAL